MKFIKKHATVSIFVAILTLLLIIVFIPKITYASEVEGLKHTTDAYEFYHYYKNDSLIKFNEADGYIYYCSCGTLAGDYAYVKYKMMGHRYTIDINGEKYYIETLRGDEGGNIEKTAHQAYDSATGNHNDGNYYYLMKISYDDLAKILERKYPNADFSSMYIHDSQFTITIDSIMTVVINGEPEGRITKECQTNGKHNGTIETTGSLYYTKKEMQDRYGVYNPTDFKDFYNKKIIVRALAPTVTVSSVTVSRSDSYLYKKSNGVYYIKLDKNFNLKFTTTTSFANDIMQPHVSVLNAKSGTSGVNGKIYLTTTKGSNSSSLVKDNTIFTTSSGSATRSNGNKTLDATFVVQLKTDKQSVDFYPQAKISNDNLKNNYFATTAFDTSKKVTVIADGSAPTISVSGIASDWKNANQTLSATASDNGSGVKSFVLKNSSGTVLKSGTTSLSYTFSTEGTSTYTLTATDNVGNVSTKTITVKIDKTAPTISNISTSYGWTKNNVSISPTASDSLSGMSSYVLKGSAGTTITSGTTSLNYTFTLEGTNTYTLTATDKAGNTTTKTFTVKIDKTAPTFSEINELYDWTNKEVVLKPQSSDILTNVQSIELFNENSVLLASGVDTFEYKYKKEGVSHLTLKATDSVGNVGVYNITIKQDFTSPVAINGTDEPNDELNATATNGYFYSRNYELLFKTFMKDQTNLSGIMTIYLRNPNGELVYSYDNRTQETDARYEDIMVHYDLETSPTRSFKGWYFTLEAYDYAGNVIKKKIMFADTFNNSWVRIIIY